MKKCLCIIAAILVLLPTIVFADETVFSMDSDNVLRVALTGALPDYGLDPAVVVIESTGDILRNVYERLVEAAPDGETMVPGLAESWDISDDGLTYTFHLRSGVTFADSAAFKADDVKYSFERAMELNSGTAWILNDYVEEIQVEDELTVKIQIKQAFAPFLRILTNPMVCSILSEETSKKHATADDPYAKEYYRANMNGTGAFKFEEWRPSEYLVISRNDGYWGEKSKIDGVVFQVLPEPETVSLMLRKGDLDMSGAMPNELIEYLAKQEGIVIDSQEILNHYSFAFNTSLKPIDNVKVRQALAYAMDYDSLMQYIVGDSGVKMSGYIMQGMLGFDPENPGYQRDVEKAKQLLAEAGYENGFDLELPYPVWGPLPDVCVLAQASFAEIGVNVKLVQVGFGPFLDAINNNKAAIFPWNGSPYYNDPDGLMYASLHSDFIGKGSGGNIQHYASSEMDKLLEQGRFEQDETTRAGIYKQANALFNQDVPRIFLWQAVKKTVMRERVQGFQYPLLPGFIDYKGVYFKEPAS